MPTLTHPIRHAGRPVQPANYIFPPRAQDAIPLSETTLFAQMDWIAQFKYNDGRALIKYLPGEPIELWNRHAEKFRTYSAPDRLIQQLEAVHQKLGLSRTSWSLLDGGVLDQKHRAIKNTIVIWDILVLDGVHLLGSTYGDRHNFLTGKLDSGSSWIFNNIDFGIRVNDDILVPRNIPGDKWQEAWSIVEEANKAYDKNSPLLEGLVLKDGSGKLKPGFKEKNNDHWQCRSRVTTGRHRF